MGVKTNRTSF